MAQPFEEIRNFRIKKLEMLRSVVKDVYPASLPFAIEEIANITEGFKKSLKSKKAFGVGGRILARRGHGGSMFLDITDGSTSNAKGGSDTLQIFIAKDKLGNDNFELLSDTLDVGDFAIFWGRPFLTKSKEFTLEAHKWGMLAKSLRPLPEKWHGLQDTEERFRKRYLDILMNKEIRDRFLFRPRLIKNLREILGKAEFVEVETPILQPLYGGALAEPFKTHHRMLDFDMYLRIAPELYLKRLLAAGYSKIYEIGRNFRNEGLDATHNPEFTTIELYAAYRDAEYLKKFVAEVLLELIKKTTGSSSFKFGGHTINFKKNVPSIPFWQVIERYALIPEPEKLSRDELSLQAERFGIKVESHESKAKIADEIFKKKCRPKMTQPTYIIHHPIDISPLAKNLRGDENLVDRFQLVVGGIEMVNGFSELNDPLEQRKRMEVQEKMRKEGDKESEPLDEDFIEMLEYGMPPAAGVGISIDRLTMLLTDTQNIKEVILFPTMKPK